MNNNLPLYIIIKNDITSQIFSGKLNPGDKIPSVREYAIEHKMNINTITNAFTKLDAEGLTMIKRGQGRFVTEDVEFIDELFKKHVKDSIDQFVQEMDTLGLSVDDIIYRLKGKDE